MKNQKEKVLGNRRDRETGPVNKVNKTEQPEAYQLMQTKTGQIYGKPWKLQELLEQQSE